MIKFLAEKHISYIALETSKTALGMSNFIIKIFVALKSEVCFLFNYKQIPLTQQLPAGVSLEFFLQVY